MCGQSASASTKLSDPTSWVDRHGDGLFRYAMLRLNDAQIAEDLVQEAFLAALTARKEYSGAASERTWLTAILRHKIFDHIRKSCAQRTEPPGPQSENLDEPVFDGRGKWKKNPCRLSISPDQIAEQRKFWNVFRTCVSKLPPQLVQAYHLREIERVASDTVCKVLHITATNLWTRLHRARMSLRRCLEDNWFSTQIKRAAK